MSDSAMEKEIIDKGLTYPRVTKDYIEGLLASVEFDCHVVTGTTTTVVTSYLPMGHIKFTLSTEIMACVDPRNFNKELGEKYGIEKAKASAKNKLWELEGYRLAHSIINDVSNSIELSYLDRMQIESKELDQKVVALDKFIKDNPIFGTLEWAEQSSMKYQLAAMVNYAFRLDERIDLLTSSRP